jgi:hypothetical protein
MATYEFNYKEVNQGFASIEADTLEEAEKLASEMYYAGEVVWHDTEVSYNAESENA